jgi:hypothetical protein
MIEQHLRKSHILVAVAGTLLCIQMLRWPGMRRYVTVGNIRGKVARLFRPRMVACGERLFH